MVASSFGTLASRSPRLHPRFDVARTSLADAGQVMDDYVEAGSHKPSSSRGAAGLTVLAGATVVPRACPVPHPRFHRMRTFE